MHRLIGFWAATWLLGAIPAGAGPMFNGKNLDGWSGDPRLWRVEEGVIIGETDGDKREIKANSFLIWEGGEVADFELSYKARVIGDNNSGVQYRSQVKDPSKWVMAGYQMDLHAKPEYLGMLYDEKGRGILCERGQKTVVHRDKDPQVDGELKVPDVDLSKWNEYKIVARGPRLQHFVNGELAVEVRDLDRKNREFRGRIGLQVHRGKPMRAEFKDFKLRHLGNGAYRQSGPNQQAVAWIWTQDEPRGGEKVFFRRGFHLPHGVKKAELSYTCDDMCQVWVNGVDLGMTIGWETATHRDVTQAVRPGMKNIIAIEGRNQGGPAGLAVRFRATLGDGRQIHLLSDNKWHYVRESDEGWQKTEYQPQGWERVEVVGRMGDAPWGAVMGGGDAGGLPRDVSGSYQVLPGFKLEKVYEVPTEYGSWVAMTVDGEGRLICSDQYGAIYRVEPATRRGEPTRVEKLPIPLRGAHGLLWHGDSLYVTVNEVVKPGDDRGNELVQRWRGKGGVYRVDDRDGDGTPETPTLLKEMDGRGEHGPHSLVPSPDGKWIYFCAGNMTKLAEMDASFPARVWDEDQLLPRRPDPRGHAVGKMAPGGWIARFSTDDANRWELVSIGFRNEFDIAFDSHGQLFSYDADMEWDLGLPWYRPTRICQVIPGAEFGWRNGTGKWPEYYEDSMPSAHDIGPGSPTGLLSGRGAAFPERYQRAIYAFDWTYATIHAIHLEPEGAGYGSRGEELVAGTGLPLTDAAIGADGAMYFLTGGRRTDSALWRVSYVGGGKTDPVEFASELPRQPDAREARAALSSDGRVERQRARLWFEADPSRIPDGLLESKTAWEVIQGALMQIRLQGGSEAKWR